MSLIMAAKRDLLRRLYEQEEGKETTAIDDWFDNWVYGYFGHATVLAKGEPYQDDPKYLADVRTNLKWKLACNLTKEDGVMDETADIDRVKRLMRMTIYVIQKPNKQRKDEIVAGS